MNETSILLNVLNSFKILIGKNELETYRKTDVKRILITIIKCISIDDRHLHSLITRLVVTQQNI